MPHKTIENLSRRERQIMDIIYQRGSATAMDVMDGLSDPPSYSAVRAMLRILEEKGIVNDGDRIIITRGDMLGDEGGGTNAMKVITIGKVKVSDK